MARFRKTDVIAGSLVGIAALVMLAQLLEESGDPAADPCVLYRQAVHIKYGEGVRAEAALLHDAPECVSEQDIERAYAQGPLRPPSDDEPCAPGIDPPSDPSLARLQTVAFEALVLHESGRLREALAPAREALALACALHDEGDPQVDTQRHLLVSVLTRTGDTDAALEILSRVGDYRYMQRPLPPSALADYQQPYP